MKKIFCILFLFSAIVSSIFADKNRFYENGKVIDTMNGKVIKPNTGGLLAVICHQNSLILSLQKMQLNYNSIYHLWNIGMNMKIIKQTIMYLILIF
ncbi:hypothetical protein HMPREF0860_2473 [Treponema socranskii subsp. socranskii VPI DR56BR1116 = ATCC 35536]|uniref:Uncharacterized protein n=1 Tax=Treponema socranskii subsp. socranskii VPI DR56BR1116 = ATCC 35536 TaxID=1125725 RepID=A0ABP2YLU4_TRESO|nr:hypothetical protein [Treponema socranskii]ERK03265.1 hypothetical protein HMPREF0860_2473 [Treponema socranskii subsp. socranskii VPI DR56BR1116 = ATCC 35536]